MLYNFVDNEKAAVIAQDLALAKNSSATELSLGISDKLTVSGAQVIAYGLEHSRIRQLQIWHQTLYANGSVGLHENVLQPILEVTIRHLHIQELQLHFDMNDGVAERLSEMSLSLDDNGANNRSLQSLELNIGPNLTEAAAQQLANALHHAKLKSLVLKAGANMASRNIASTIYLEAMRSMEKLVLIGSMMTGDEAGEFGNALIGNTTLQSVKFGLQIDMSIDDAVRLANGISRSHIVRLEIESRKTSIWEDAEDVLYEGIAKLPAIQHLVVGYGLCGTSGLAGCLTRLHTLQTHHLVVVEDLPGLVTGLISAPHLTSLNLGQCLEKEQDMLAVCAALPQLVSLTDLTMSCTLAFDEQASQAGDVVPHFDLRKQHIRASGAEQLMLAVANNLSLVSLTLVWPNDIGYMGLAMIGMHLPNIKLKKLYLSEMFEEYYLSSGDESVERAFQRACQALVIGVQSNWHLHGLALVFDYFFPSKAVDEIDFYLDLNKSGRYLLHDTDSEDIPMGLWCHVLAKCSNKAGHLFYYLRELPTLACGSGHVPF